MLVSRNAVLAFAVTLATTLSLLASDNLKKRRDKPRPTTEDGQTPEAPIDFQNAPAPFRVDRVTRPNAVYPKVATPKIGTGRVYPSALAAVRGFGPDCPELDAPMRMSRSGPRHGYYLYADKEETRPDDPSRVRIASFSLVWIHRNSDGVMAQDQIVTLRAKSCEVGFGREIDLRRLGSWGVPDELVLRGEVRMTNNLGTADPTDDIELTTDKSARIDVRRRRIEIRGPGRMVRYERRRAEGEGIDGPRSTPIDWDGALVLDGNRLRIEGNVRGTNSDRGLSWFASSMEFDIGHSLFPHADPLRGQAVPDTAPDRGDDTTRERK